MGLGTISTSGEVRELDQEGSWQSYAFMATVVSAAFLPVSLTLFAQFLEIQKQCSKRMDDYDDEEEEEDAKAPGGGGDGKDLQFSNPLQEDGDGDDGAENEAAQGGDGNEMKFSNPLQEDGDEAAKAGEVTPSENPVQVSVESDKVASDPTPVEKPAAQSEGGGKKNKSKGKKKDKKKKKDVQADGASAGNEMKFSNPLQEDGDDADGDDDAEREAAKAGEVTPSENPVQASVEGDKVASDPMPVEKPAAQPEVDKKNKSKGKKKDKKKKKDVQADGDGTDGAANEAGKAGEVTPAQASLKGDKLAPDAAPLKKPAAQPGSKPDKDAADLSTE
jgi:hypothetical protein